MNRIKLYVKKVFQCQVDRGEDCIEFEDKEGKRYSWFTRSVITPISLEAENEYFYISASIKGYNSDGYPVLKNVRLLKGE